MANGDPLRAGAFVAAQTTTGVWGPQTFADRVIFVASAANRFSAANVSHPVDGMLGIGLNTLAEQDIIGGTGVVGLGSPVNGTGVVGIGSFQGIGGAGVLGIGGPSAQTDRGESRFAAGPGVTGLSVKGSDDRRHPAPGVLGQSESTDGIWGFCDLNGRSGVYGWNGVKRGDGYGVYGRCNSPSGTGVAGSNESLRGGIGVSGRSSHIGVLGEGTWAGWFRGSVAIENEKVRLPKALGPNDSQKRTSKSPEPRHEAIQANLSTMASEYLARAAVLMEQQRREDAKETRSSKIPPGTKMPRVRKTKN